MTATAPSPQTDTERFLQTQYIARHDSANQRKYRQIRPWPCGVVFIEHPGMTLEDIRSHFRLMKELGFTALKQCQTLRTTDNARVMHMAIDEGLCPWWYGEGGWEQPTPELLGKLGIDADTPIEQLREDDRWIEHQKQVWHDRVDREAAGEAGRKLMKQGEEVPDRVKGQDWVPSVQPDFQFELTEPQCPLFLDWLKRTYGTIEALNEAWNVHHCMVPGPSNQSGEFERSRFWESWEHLGEELPAPVNGGFREYRRTRDVYRFKADNYINWLRDRFAPLVDADPHAPMRAGGEMGLFLPFASRGTDMEGIADLMTEWGSFYPSFHPSWHFEEVDFETPTTFYMQSSITTDWFKGGWNATWESTGGPQQMTGGKAPFVPAARDKKPGFTVDAGVMTQLMLSWIAGGYRGFGQWCWSMRTAGWEGGEFALLDRNNRVTERARVAGAIGKACRRLTDELWDAWKQPQVGVFQDWDMEAIWAAASRGGRDFYKSEPIRARIGAARALINANVPWEHVTGDDLDAGLAGRYESIILPACLGIGDEVLERLIAFVEAGGRVVMDAPGAWYDYYGRVRTHAPGSTTERLFGARIKDFQYSQPKQMVWTIEGQPVIGTTYDLEPTTADVAVPFDAGSGGKGRPAVTVNRLGKGQAVLLGWEATRACTDPGHTWGEAKLIEHILGDIDPLYACDACPVYRLAAPTADHYFLINGTDKAVDAELDTRSLAYASAEDPIANEPLTLGTPIHVDAHSGRWVRLVK